MHHTLFNDINIPRIKAEGEDLDQISPDEQAVKIQIPVLLVHGKQDFTVPVEHSERMARALECAGHPAETLYLDGADHYLSHGEDRLAFLKALGAFLAKNLPTKAGHS